MEQATIQPTELKKVDGATKDTAPSTSQQEKQPSEEAKKKTACKKHTPSKKAATKSKKSKKPAKKEASSDSDDTSSSSESEEEDSEEDEDSSDSDSALDAPSKKKKKAKKAKAKAKMKALKKQLRVLAKQAGEEEDDEDEDSEETLTARTQAAKLKALKKAQRHDGQDEFQILAAQAKASKLKALRQAQAEDDDDDELNDPYQRALRNQLGLGLAGQPVAGGRRRAIDSSRAALGRQNLSNLEQRILLEQLDQKKKAAQTKKKRASTVAYKRVDQLWDSTIHNYKLTETVADQGADEWDQYIFTVRRKFDWEHKYQETMVDIKSKPLKEALQHIMAGVKGITLVQDTPHIDPNMLFLYLEESRAYMKKCEEESRDAKKKKERKLASAKAQHLKILCKYLDKDYAETKKTLYPMLESGMISFDLLWALFKPNSIAYTTTYADQDQPRAFKVDFATKQQHFMKGTWYDIEGKYLEYDGKSFGMGSMAVQVSQFQGARRISSLDCFPLQYHKDPEKTKADLIERGKKFVALEGVHYKYHKGMAYTKRKRQILKINIDGRIMCDPAIHRRINPNYQVSTVKPKETDEDFFEPSGEEEDDSCGCCGGSSSEEGDDQRNTPSSSEDTPPRRRFRVVKDQDGRTTIVEVDPNDEEEALAQKDRITETEKGVGHAFLEEELLIASPVVLGFAFSEKLWLEFTVSGISDVRFNEDAFDSLVLPDNQKSIVKALVSSHAFHPSKSIDDIISGKGRGLCCVLHGPPGTGKTLTAEGIADLLKCPLYMVSAGDLGTDPRNLEKELQNILDIAHSWGAILLLDEADVFLEKRSIHDIHRNALVSIFLRLLEYFQGILFLTTNRVETFDEAFVSRIHLSLRYEELSTKARHRVWKLFLEKVKSTEGVEVGKITDSDYMDLARRDVNGRQIKNLVRAAQALAVYENKPLSMAHIKRVIDVAESFERDLKGGTGYSDAMRSTYL